MGCNNACLFLEPGMRSSVVNMATGNLFVRTGHTYNASLPYTDFDQYIHTGICTKRTVS